ncbi:MAG: STAS domain-containing protein [Candidatus Acidiferrales bacterium]
MALHLTARTFAGATIVECSGRLVLGEESASLRDLVKSTLTESKRVVLELGDVYFIDSAGVGLLARLYASAQLAGGMLKLANLSPRMQDMLKITKLFVVFEIFDTAEDAARSF